MLKFRHTTLLLISLFSFFYGNTKESMIHISGELSNRIHAHEITFTFWHETISESLVWNAFQKRIKVPIKDGRFNLEVNADQPWLYLSFAWEFDPHGNPIDSNPYLYIAESGDSIYVKIDSSKGQCYMNFQGRGAAKYNAIANVARNSRSLSSTWYRNNTPKYDPNNFKEFKIKKGEEATKYLIQKELAILAQYKEQMNKTIYEQYQINLFSNKYMWLCVGLGKTLFYRQKNVSYEEVWKEINQAVLDIQRKTSELEENVNSVVLSRSPQYIDLKRLLAMINATLHSIPIERVLSAPEQNEIRDKALTAYIVRASPTLEIQRKDSLIRFAEAVVQNTHCRDLLKSYIEETKTGQTVYDFTLSDTNGAEIRLSNFRGKIVFLDFWFIGCGNCSAYYQNVVKPVKKKYKNNEDVVFITISIDKDRKKWIEAIKSGQYTSSESINLHCPDGIENPVIQQFAVRSFPKPLLVDREGRVYSDSEIELRHKGVDGLMSMIEKARND